MWPHILRTNATRSTMLNWQKRKHTSCLWRRFVSVRSAEIWNGTRFVAGSTVPIWEWKGTIAGKLGFCGSLVSGRILRRRIRGTRIRYKYCLYKCCLCQSKKITIPLPERQSPQPVKRRQPENGLENQNRKRLIISWIEELNKDVEDTPFLLTRLRRFMMAGYAFSPMQRIKRLIIHLTGMVVVYEK